MDHILRLQISKTQRIKESKKRKEKKRERERKSKNSKNLGILCKSNLATSVGLGTLYPSGIGAAGRNGSLYMENLAASSPPVGPSLCEFIGECLSASTMRLFNRDEYFRLRTTKKNKYLFLKGATRILVLCRDLRLLRDSLEDSVNKCNDRQKFRTLESRIIDLAYRSEDAIEEFLMDSEIEVKMMNFVNHVFNVDPTSLITRVDFERDVRGIIDKKNSVHNCLQLTLKEVDFIKKKMRKIHVEQPVTGNLQLGNASTNDLSHHTSSWETEVIGLDDDLLSHIDRLTLAPPNLERVAIVGMGGIGKTTLASRVYKDPKIAYHFHVRAWVTVSQVHRMRDVLLGLLNCLSPVTNAMQKEQ